MPALLNARHELFAQELANGKPAVEAHRLAGYRPLRSSASRLQHDANICERVAELLSERNEIAVRATENMACRQKPRTARTEQRARDVFLAALAAGVSVTGACSKAGLPRSTVYDWRDADSEFARQWGDAIESGTDLMEDEAVRRAVHGVAEPIVTMGKVARNEDGSIMTVQKYSDTLLVRLLIARRRKSSATACRRRFPVLVAGRSIEPKFPLA